RVHPGNKGEPSGGRTSLFRPPPHTRRSGELKLRLRDGRRVAHHARLLLANGIVQELQHLDGEYPRSRLRIRCWMDRATDLARLRFHEGRGSAELQRAHFWVYGLFLSRLRTLATSRATITGFCAVGAEQINLLGELYQSLRVWFLRMG